MLHHVLLGCGYLGLRVGRLWIARGDSVAVLTRSSQRAKQFGEEGFTPIVGDVTQPSSISGLFSRPERPHSVVYAIGYDRSQTKASIGEVYAGGLAAVLQK